jgi:flavin reductase
MVSTLLPAARPTDEERGGSALAMEELFRAAMRTFTSSVTLVTSRTVEGEWRGLAATAVTSVSMAPPTCLVCVNREASLYSAVIASRLFCINAMHQDHHALMASFTTSENRGARFLSGAWRPGRDGLPFLENAQFNIFCEIFDRFSVGTHDVVVGRVLEVKSRPDRDPLLYGDGAYLRQAAR